MRMAVALNSEVPDFGINRINGEIVGGDLIGKMHGEKSQTLPQAVIKPYRGNHRASTRSHAHFFSFAQIVLLPIFG